MGSKSTCLQPNNVINNHIEIESNKIIVKKESEQLKCETSIKLYEESQRNEKDLVKQKHTIHQKIDFHEESSYCDMIADFSHPSDETIALTINQLKGSEVRILFLKLLYQYLHSLN